MCHICRDSKTHTDHKFRPIDEAAQDHREELQSSLKLLQNKLELVAKVRLKFDQTTKHIKVQARHKERQIKEQFKRLHPFLEDGARMAARREEEEQKSQRMEED